MPATLTVFGWGSLGGVATALAVFVLPILNYVAITGNVAPRHRERALGTLLTVMALGALAGILALTLPDTVTRGQAILTGIASPAIAKGIARAGLEATTPGWWLQQAAPRGL